LFVLFMLTINHFIAIFFDIVYIPILYAL